MQYKLVCSMLSMAACVLAGPIPKPGEPMTTNTRASNGASPTPIDLKLDVNTLGKMFPLSPELRKLSAPGEPLELRVSLGKPGQADIQREAEEASRTESESARLARIHWEGGINVASSTAYNPYKGNGSPGQGWPTPDQWISYDSMKRINRDIIMNSCSNNGWGVPNNSPQETDQIFNSVDRIATTAHLDRRFILAIILQETKGCARVHTTYGAGGVGNPGLMQSHNGKSTCNSGTLGAPKNVQVPCPEATIMEMIHEGVVGVSNGPNDVSLLKMISRSGMGTVADLYRAARLYNSGPAASLWNLQDGGAGTASYVTDIANRLTGWVG